MCRIQELLHRRLSEAVLACAGAFAHSHVQLPGSICSSSFLARGVQPLTKGHAVELADAVGLGRLGSCAGTVDVHHRQVELVLVRFPIAAVFRALIAENPQQRHIGFLLKRKDAIIERVSRHQRHSCGYAAGESHLGIGVNKGSLVNAPMLLISPTAQTSKIIPQPYATNSSRGNHHAQLGQLIGHPDLPQSRFLSRQSHDRILNMFFDSVLDARLAPADLL